MKHHIAVKFIAVCLAALLLLTAIGSGIGIVGLVAWDLYDGSVEELYNESMQSTRQTYAVNLAHRYASLHLGNLPEQYLNDYYGLNWMYSTFQYGYFYYTIRNEHGDVVESTMEDAPTGGTHYEMAVTNIRYRALVEILNPTEPTAEPTIPVTTAPPETEITMPPETTAPTIMGTEPGAEDQSTIPPEDGLETASDYAAKPEPEVIYDSYFDYETEQFVEFTFTYQYLPPYTVDLYLLPGAMPEEYAWTILRTVWEFRYELIYLLCGSLLLFAVLSVYLCCTAGKKPGRQEIRAGGLNCIPLDLYFVAGSFGIAAIIYFGCYASYFLLRESPNILVPFVVLAGYLCSLLLVGFGFACAAQFKTSGHYWLRNSLCGRCVRLFAAFGRWLEKFLGTKFFPFLGRSLKFCWRSAIILCKGTYLYTEKFLILLFKGMGKIAQRTYAWLHAFMSLLPVTWQWLLVGFGLLLLMVITVSANNEELLVFLCAGISLATVLYGAHCFGILWDSTKKMSQGDLQTNVDDKLMVGCFKDFAADLNALADVAVVAAQKQLKSERMKTELITNVSHDIKTPLTSIINYVDLLQKPHTEEEQEIYLEVLSRQSGQLKKLIDDLMEMSKASTGNMAVDITSVNAAEAVNQALGEFADKLALAQLVPVFRQGEEPIYMRADGRLAWRVMSNLLSNAVKYAMPGTRLYIDLMELEGKVIISMKNISREELNVSADELLERFVRGDASRNTEGSGLGLNIAQSLMELQKGQLQLLVDGDLFKVTLVFPAA